MDSVSLACAESPNTAFATDTLSWELSALGGMKSLEQTCLEPLKFQRSQGRVIEIYRHVGTENMDI